MPDFLDRLIARSGRPDGGGPGHAAASAGPDQPAGMAMARPRVPGLFERCVPHAAETGLVAEAVPQTAQPGFTDLPRATAPAVAQPRTHARLVQVPAAHPGGEHDREPGQPPPAAVAALLPVAPQLVPVTAAASAVQPPGQGGTPAVRMQPGKDLGGGPGAPAAPGTAGTSAPQARPRIVAAALAPRVPVPAQPGGAAVSRPSRIPPPPAGPIVRISIGRIEVRPAGPPGGHGPAKRAAARPAPALSLDRFLAGGAGER